MTAAYAGFMFETVHLGNWEGTEWNTYWQCCSAGTARQSLLLVGSGLLNLPLASTALLRAKKVKIMKVQLRAVDPHSFFADPDPAVFLNADPDPGGKINADPCLYGSSQTNFVKVNS